MNPRTLGTLCAAGALIGVANGVRMIADGRPLTPGLLDLEPLTAAVIVISAAGALCGLAGFVALRATGDKPAFRLLTYLPAISYLATIVFGLALLTGSITSDDTNPVAVVGALLMDIVAPATWLVVGILTIAAKQWNGWRRFAPFAPVAGFALGAMLSSASGLVGVFHLMWYSALALFGFAVRSAASQEMQRLPVTQPA